MSTCQGAAAPHESCPHGRACDWIPPFVQRGIHWPHCRDTDCHGCMPAALPLPLSPFEQGKAGRLPQPAMSRRQRREQERKHGKPDPTYALMPAACLDEPEAISNAMDLSHDGVIATAGAARRSGVTWRQFKGEDATRTFEQLFGDDPQTAALDQFRAFFAEHRDRAVLIVASCEVVRP